MTSKLIISTGAERILWGQNPRKLSGGLFFAGKGQDENWYSETALGGDSLYRALVQPKYENILKYLKENKETRKIVPWLQIPDKPHTLEEFIEENIAPHFKDFILLNPKLGGTEYLVNNGTGYETTSYEIAKNMKDFDAGVIANINELTDFWIATFRPKLNQ